MGRIAFKGILLYLYDSWLSRLTICDDLGSDMAVPLVMADHDGGF